MAENSNELSVKITAEIDDLKKGLTKAEKEIGSFGDKAEKAAKKTEGISKAADTNNKSLKNLANGLENTVGGVEDLTRSSGDLSDKLRGVGKIATGTTSSLAGVGGSALIAVGGILAVAAAVGTALYFYGKHRAEAYDLELQYKNLNDRIKEYEKSLWGIQKVQLKGTQGAASQIATLTSLRAQINDTTLSHEERTKAIDALRKKYPSYFKDLSDEKILLGKVGVAYNSLTDDILKNARAKAGLEALTANLKKQFALEIQLLKNTEKIQKEADNRALLRTQEKYITMSDGAAVYNAREAAFTNEITDLLDDQKKIADDIVDIQKEAAKYAKIISDNGGILPLGTPGQTPGGAKDDAAATASKFINFSGIGMFDPMTDNQEAFQNTFRSMSAQVELLVDEFNNNLPELDPPEFDKDKMTEELSYFQNWMMQIEQFMEDFATNIQMIVTDNITSAFAGIGFAIGEALATGGDVLGSMGSALKQAFANFLGDMGVLLIEYGTLAIAKGILDEATWIPGAGIAAGAAAIAVGVAMTAVSGAMGSMANTGSTGNYSSASAASTGSSTSISRSSFNSGDEGGTYIFKIAGTELIGVIENSLARNKSMGGSNVIIG